MKPLTKIAAIFLLLFLCLSPYTPAQTYFARSQNLAAPQPSLLSSAREIATTQKLQFSFTLTSFKGFGHGVNIVLKSKEKSIASYLLRREQVQGLMAAKEEADLKELLGGIALYTPSREGSGIKYQQLENNILRYYLLKTLRSLVLLVDHEKGPAKTHSFTLSVSFATKFITLKIFKGKDEKTGSEDPSDLINITFDRTKQSFLPGESPEILERAFHELILMPLLFNPAIQKEVLGILEKAESLEQRYEMFDEEIFRKEKKITKRVKEIKTKRALFPTHLQETELFIRYTAFENEISLTGDISKLIKALIDLRSKLEKDEAKSGYIKGFSKALKPWVSSKEKREQIAVYYWDHFRFPFATKIEIFFRMLVLDREFNLKAAEVEEITNYLRTTSGHKKELISRLSEMLEGMIDQPQEIAKKFAELYYEDYEVVLDWWRKKGVYSETGSEEEPVSKYVSRFYEQPMLFSA